MTSYATVGHLREYLLQADKGAAGDALLQSCLDRATSTINGRLGFAYSDRDVTTDKDIRAVADSEYLDLPAHQAGSVSAVGWVWGKATDYEHTEAITDCDELPDGRLWREMGWWRREWYRVTAVWGYGPPPEALVQVCIEIAINEYGARDSKQISDVVGVQGAVGYNRALTNRQAMIIEDCRRQAGELGYA